ncbi:glycosyltransferase [Anaerolinea thermophila]|uniref:Glycosyltransferase n=1 Tax=Anaerolinea thermophila (strain DSM 14523 / JCM 11388 / NBRC 100420 / UNI-1) TaxID=926569 RepID=E8MZ64_ANATU|nr:glycosyltransferase [Anaerolinea thermophila]BAJ62207.1 putative glycosyltransferase [Anaerolinea thermophila UNI-1]
MNIAMLSYHTCPLATLGGKDTGGMNVYVREVTRFLGMRGVHVDVFTRSQDEHVPHVLHDLGFGNRVVHLPAGAETWLPKRQLVDFIPQFAEGVLRFAREKGIHYDLIHANYWMSGIAAETLKAEWNVPVVTMFHTLGLMKNRIARSPEEMEGEYRINGERRVLQISDRIIAATLAEKAQLQFLYQADEGKIRIVPPGVDTARFYPIPREEACEAIGIPPEDRMLLFVGRIEPLKGLDTLMRAIAILRECGVQCHVPHYLAVVGGDPSASGEKLSDEMARLQALRRELHLEDLVLFLGKRAQDTLPYYYSAAEVLIMPSHYESFGMVALEAMACGTPVVASQVGGLAFLVQDGLTGYVVPDGDPQALSERLRLLLMDGELRQRMGLQAAAYARQYAWENIVERLLGVYSEVLTC